MRVTTPSRTAIYKIPEGVVGVCCAGVAAFTIGVRHVDVPTKWGVAVFARVLDHEFVLAVSSLLSSWVSVLITDAVG